MSSDNTSTSQPLTTTSFTLSNIEESLRPKELVACMNCPIAVWYLVGRAVNCYCRMLYIVVWVTQNPGRIKVCDYPALAAAAAKGE